MPAATTLYISLKLYQKMEFRNRLQCPFAKLALHCLALQYAVQSISKASASFGGTMIPLSLQ